MNQGPSPANSLVDVNNLSVHFPADRSLRVVRARMVHAVDNVTLAIRRGETLALVGESGCGKSTLGRALIQLVKPTAGSVTFDGIELTNLRGEEMRRMRSRLQIIFQDPYASLNPRMTVGRTISVPLSVHHLARGAERQERIAELLKLVGLDPQMADRYPHEFSGGQRQRIGIARALAVEPEFIVADEPVSALDVSIQAQIVNLLMDLQDRLGLTFLFVAHDLALVRHVADRVAVMYLGKIVEIATRGTLFKDPLHPYTEALLSAVPTPEPSIGNGRARILLEGDLPSPIDPPSGCRFRTRCPLFKRLGSPEVCVQQEPPLVDNGAEHLAACHFTAK